MGHLTRLLPKHRRAAIWGLIGSTLCGTLTARCQQYSFALSSQPPGLIANQSNSYASGTLVQTSDAPQTALYSGTNYGFAYWLVNGQPALAASGQSVNEASLIIATNTTAVACYLPATQEASQPGIPDYLE